MYATFEKFVISKLRFPTLKFRSLSKYNIRNTKAYFNCPEVKYIKVFPYAYLSTDKRIIARKVLKNLTLK